MNNKMIIAFISLLLGLLFLSIGGIAGLLLGALFGILILFMIAELTGGWEYFFQACFDLIGWNNPFT